MADGDAPTAPEPGFITGVLDSLQLEICVVDAHGNVIVWNRGLEKRVAKRAEVLGRPIEQVLERFTRPEWGVDWATRIRAEVLGAAGAFDVHRYPQRTADGGLMLCDVNVAPIVGSHGRPVGAVMSLRDVTDKARLEVESVRTAKAQELAQLGASVAHEIRNPLNSIGMNAQLLREEVEALVDKAGGEEDDGDGVVATADLIVREIKRLNGVVTSFLTYARQPDLKLERADPNHAVRRAMQLLEPEAAKAAVKMTAELQLLPDLMCDKDQLSQAVYNVLLNGIQELQGGGALSVSTHQERTVAVIEVTDTGRGIPPEQRSQIFELFQTSKEGGTGLGLPIAKRIVEAHGGRIVADNAPQGGGRFRIYLPLEAPGLATPGEA